MARQLIQATYPEQLRYRVGERCEPYLAGQNWLRSFGTTDEHAPDT
jgi:hypothetical protein